MFNRVEISDRFAALRKLARERAGKSQEYMAHRLGVSKKTIQNWEAGASSPSFETGFEWFSALGQSPLPYILQAFYPDLFNTLGSGKTDEADYMLHILISRLSPASKSGLLYLLCGDHGSSPPCVIEMITAHLQCPLRDRVNIAQSVLINYEIAKDTSRLRNPDQVQPNVIVLEEAISMGKDAIKKGLENYSPI